MMTPTSPTERYDILTAHTEWGDIRVDKRYAKYMDVIFHTVLEYEDYTKAAKDLNIPKDTLNKWIRRVPEFNSEYTSLGLSEREKAWKYADERAEYGTGEWINLTCKYYTRD